MGFGPTPQSNDLMSRGSERYPSVQNFRKILMMMAVVAAAAMLLLATGPAMLPSHAQHSPVNANAANCNCVIIRVDDIQDYWKQKPQIALLDIFINDSASLSVGMVMNHFGSDPVIVNKVKEGGSLFEYGIHGWDHVDYATLSAPQQQETISKAQAKMESVMGRSAKVFLPPYNGFDTNTLIAIKLSGLEIISASKADANPYAPANDTLGIMHMPQSTTYGFTGSDGRSHQWRTIEEMKSAVDADIDARGWAVVTIHPQDFATYDENGKMLDLPDRKSVV